MVLFAIFSFFSQNKTHFGSNQFLREVYLPQVWFHRISVFDSEGNPKEGNMVEQDIGGPLCFQGDYIGRVLFVLYE